MILKRFAFFTSCATNSFKLLALSSDLYKMYMALCVIVLVFLP